ncbi:MAG: hypothetical protein HYR97_03985 [Candidatus Melainabacteria bacterium]|nr:hypothetical protein [Candidatus Melainabacteria bacterium]MBI3309516.1 hypothetical protein [Candidatus Melainabacteria bacterium]
MSLSKASLIDIASDWSLDASELKAAVGRAMIAISDAIDSLEAQNDDDLASSLEDIATELYELVEEQEEE